MATQDNNLDLYMNDTLIGKLTKHTSGRLSFCYAQSWLQQMGARPISLSLPLLDKEYTRDIVQSFFDNLLPDNPDMRARVQRILQTSSIQPFDLLASTGKDCVGAIQLVNGKTQSTRKITTEPINDKSIATILKHYKTAPLGMTRDKTEFRISIAGAQEKSALLRYKNKWHLPLGITPSSHIFKLPIGFLEHQNMDLSDSCENEWLCTQITKAFGLPVANAEIGYFEDVKALVVERFDRKWSKDNSWLMRLPQEDCCQALGYSPNLKYEADGGPGIKDIMTLLLGSKKSIADREYFFCSQLLFFLLGAIDGHAKNFSLFIEPYGKYCLTPLYDIMSAYPLIAKKQLHVQKIKMAMSLIGQNKHYRWQGIYRRHFLSTAKATNFSIKKAEQIIDNILNQVDTVVTQVSNKLPANFPKAIAEPIFQGMIKATQRRKRAFH